ncbi:MAG: hypothetical protein M1549_00875 [Candidatus Dependentiae bacterium]|nr:hypothetical protein [Candidatus Dependentiae bacterium]
MFATNKKIKALLLGGIVLASLPAEVAAFRLSTPLSWVWRHRHAVTFSSALFVLGGFFAMALRAYRKGTERRVELSNQNNSSCPSNLEGQFTTHNKNFAPGENFTLGEKLFIPTDPIKVPSTAEQVPAEKIATFGDGMAALKKLCGVSSLDEIRDYVYRAAVENGNPKVLRILGGATNFGDTVKGLLADKKESIGVKPGKNWLLWDIWLLELAVRYGSPKLFENVYSQSHAQPALADIIRGLLRTDSVPSLPELKTVFESLQKAWRARRAHDAGFVRKVCGNITESHGFSAEKTFGQAWHLSQYNYEVKNPIKK